MSIESRIFKPNLLPGIFTSAGIRNAPESGGIGNIFESKVLELAKSETRITRSFIREINKNNLEIKIEFGELDLLFYLDCFGRENLSEFAEILDIEMEKVRRLYDNLQKMNPSQTLNRNQRDMILQAIYSTKKDDKKSDKILTRGFRDKYLDNLRKILKISRITTSTQ